MAASALQNSEDFYRQVIDAASDYAIIALDLAGHVTLWTRGAERLLGWEAAEMAGQDLSRLFPDGDGLAAFRREMEAARDTDCGSAEGWRQRKSGKRFWASGEMRPIRDETGVPAGYVKVLRDRTEEYEASQALRQSDALLRRAQEAGHVGIFTIDITNNMLDATPEFCRIYGVDPRADLTAERIESLVIPEDVGKPSDATKRASGTLQLDVEYRIRRPSDGAIRLISRRAELERDEQGRPLRLLGIVQDVTEQRAAQLAALESEARARVNGERVQLALAAGAIIGTWVWEVNEDRFTIDDQFAASFGIDPSLGREGLSLDQLIGTVHPDDKPGLMAAMDAAMGRGGPYAHQYRVRRTDGRYYWIEANGRVEKSADGQMRFPGVLLDIDQRRRLEEERDSVTTMLRTVMEAVPGVVYAKGRDGRMLIANDGTTQLLGMPPERYLGRTDLENLADKDQARAIMANDRHIMESGQGEQIEEAVRLANGDPAIWLSTKEPLRDETGAVIGLVGASVDITARIRAEEELRTLNQTLEERIAHAVAEREQAEAALRQAQKMEAVGQLTGGIAHDFNNLLTIITGNIEMAVRTLEKAGNDDARLHRMMGNAMIGANRAAALTQRLLAFSRRQPLSPKPVDIERLVMDISDLVTRSLGETIQLDHVFAPDLWCVEVDPNQMESALLNLAVNARDAMPQGGTLTLEAANIVIGEDTARPGEVPPGSYVLLSVTDTGTGMSRETVLHAFEPFFTTKEPGKGTGLGLSMVYGFVRQSGGHVKIKSKEGQGTTLKIYLPRLIGVQAVMAGEEEEAGFVAQSPPSRGTILVTEDDHDVRAYTVECLRELGYEVREAHDAASALVVLGKDGDGIDLLLTDVVMPGESGRALADKALAVNPALRVLFMSGYPRDAIVHDGKLDAGVELVTKPFTCAILGAKLREILKAV